MIKTTDKFSRPLRDLRISVIDRCNFRCPYCMPEEHYSKHYTFLKERDWLSFAEIIRLSRIFVGLGVTKFRITGGEPLLRPNIPQLINELIQIPEIEDVALTTNGMLLGKYAGELKKAGLGRLTISLDSLDEQIFRTMNGEKGRVEDVLNGIHAAREAGFENLKINCVVQKGVNDHTLMDLVDYVRKHQHVLRFIEYMDVGNCNHWENHKVVPSIEIYRMIHARYPLKPDKPQYYGEVAARYRFVDGHGEIGFISSVSQPFCGTCTRARLSTDGKLYTCLFANTGTDLKAPLRQSADDQTLQHIIRDVWQSRADKYSENRNLFRSLKENSRKIEMYQIGG